MKKAFTMIELVFVIVVIGILAAVIIPNMRTNPVYEAATDLTSKIRYAQHLAMLDDQFDAANTTWYRNRWQIAFSGTNNIQYSITHLNSAGTQIYAIDPLTNKPMQNVDLQAKYNVTVSTHGTECGGATVISFDNLGRPIVGNIGTATSAYAGPNMQLIKTKDCMITLHGSEDVNISIEPETGYVHIIKN